MSIRYAETPRITQWADTLMSNLHVQTGRTLEAWAEVFRECPETTPKKQQAWLKAQHGVGQNHAFNIIEAAKGAGLPNYHDPAAMVKALFSRRTEQIPVYEQVATWLCALDPSVVASPRKGYIPFSRRKQFAVLQPGKNGLVLGLALKAPPAHPRLDCTRKNVGSERITACLDLADVGAFDTEAQAWARLAYEEN